MDKFDKKNILQVDAIVDHALTLDQTQRDAYLAESCADNPTLRSLVDSLLSKALSVLDKEQNETLPWHSQSLFQQAISDTMASNDYRGKQLGQYELLELAGQGGMGQVYRAQRTDGYFEQQVAVKVLPELTTMLAADAYQQFRNEMHIMGKLRHPHIAQIYDAGVDTEGTAYLVMEWVNGVSITRWCKENQLTLNARVKLWLQVVDAVQVAHSALIVHRDIKPANVLVDEQAGVKVLDFGIARSLAEIEQSDDPFILHYSRWYSQFYASPEQLNGTDVGTASDQYQLGLLLYELIVGERLRQDQHMEVWAQPIDLVQKAYEYHAHECEKIDEDLALIVQQLLAQNPEQRYSSLAAVQQDVINWLEQKPIAQKKEQKLYITHKFIQRNWIAVTSLSVIFMLVCLFAISSLHQSNQLRAAQASTLQQLERSQRVLQFLYDTLDYSDPYDQDGGAQSIAAVLEHGLEEARKQFASDPLIRAQVLSRLGITLGHRSEPEIAQTALIEAVDILQRQPEIPWVELARSTTYIGRNYLYLNELDEAEQWLIKSIAFAEKATTQEGVELQGIAYNDLGRVYDLKGDAKQQREAFTAALTLDQQMPGAISASTKALTLHNLAVVEPDNRKSLALEEEVLALRLKVFGEDHATVLHTRMIIATLHGMLGNVPAAVEQFEVALPRQAAMLGEDHRDRAIQLTHYSRQLNRIGRFDEAVSAASEALRINRLHRPNDSIYTLLSQVVLSEAQLMAGQIHQAMLTSQDLVDLVSNSGAAGFRFCLSVHDTLALTVLAQQSELEQVNDYLAHCPLAWFEQTPRAKPYLQQHIELQTLLALISGDIDLAAAQLAALDSGFQTSNTVQGFIDWRNSERQLLHALVRVAHENNWAQQQSIIEKALAELYQVLGASHWKTQLYQSLVTEYEAHQA